MALRPLALRLWIHLRDDLKRQLESRLGTLTGEAGQLQATLSFLLHALVSVSDDVVRPTISDVAGGPFLDAAAAWEKAESKQPALRARHRDLADATDRQLRTFTYERAFAQGKRSCGCAERRRGPAG